MIKCSKTCGWPQCSCEDNPDPRSGGIALLYPLGALVILAIIVTSCALTGCATPTPAPIPKVVTQTVNVPVAKSCVPAAVGDPPQYVDTDAALKAAPGAEDRYQLLAAGRTQRVGRARVVEPVITACR